MARTRKVAEPKVVVEPVVVKPEMPVVEDGWPSYLDGPVRDGPDFSFSTKDLFRFELKQYKLKAAVQDVQIKKQELTDFERQVTTRRQMLGGQLEDLVKNADRLNMELQNLKHDIQIAYKIDLQKTSYDDETGKITILE